MQKRPQNVVTQLRRRKAAGGTLTEPEEAQLRSYYASWNKQKPSLHLSRERAEQYRREADEQGMGFSSWAQLQIETARRGDSDQVLELRQENDRLRSETIGIRAVHGQLAVEHARLLKRVEDVEGRLMESMEHAIHLAQDAKVPM